MTTNEPLSLGQASKKLKDHADFIGSLGGSGELMDPVELSKIADAIDAHLTSREARGDELSVAWQIRFPLSSDQDWKTITQKQYESTLFTGHAYGISHMTKDFELRPLFAQPAAQEAAQPKGEVVQPVEAVDVRAEFEKWARSEAYDCTRSELGGGYIFGGTHSAWKGWSAAALAHPRPMGDAKSTHLPSDLRAFVMLLDKLADEWCAEEGETFRPAYELRSQVAAFVTLQPDSRRSRKGTVAAPTGGQAGEVVALRIVGRNGPYGWHDASEMDRENPPETIVGEGERVEYAYAQPRPVGVPEPHTKDHYEQDEDEQIDTYSVGHMDGWNSCREAMLAAAPAPGKGGEA